jgi:hypothetical protein
MPVRTHADIPWCTYNISVFIQQFHSYHINIFVKVLLTFNNKFIYIKFPLLHLGTICPSSLSVPTLSALAMLQEEQWISINLQSQKKQ